MITATYARGLMPKTDEILTKIENSVKFDAEKGRTNTTYYFTTKEQKNIIAIVTQLYDLGYTVSYQTNSSIKISWKLI